MKYLIAILTAGCILAGPAASMDGDPAPTIFKSIRTELDYAARSGGIFNWDVDGWIGGDSQRVWLRSEGRIEDGRAHDAEVQVYYGWNVDPFWDVLVGMRQDFEPAATSYAAISLVGLAKYDFETEASLFLSDRGDLSARLKQSFDILLTQRLIAEPHAEINLYAEDVPALNVGAGLADVELGLQLRYEIERSFAPYVDLVWQRKTGESAGLARAAGEHPEQTEFRFGLRLSF